MGANVYLPQEWNEGAQKIDMVQILYCTEMGKYEGGPIST